MLEQSSNSSSHAVATLSCVVSALTDSQCWEWSAVHLTKCAAHTVHLTKCTQNETTIYAVSELNIQQKNI